MSSDGYTEDYLSETTKGCRISMEILHPFVV